MKEKSELRIYAKNTRRNLDIDNLSDYFCQKLEQQEFFKLAKNIMIYYPLKYELNFLKLLKNNTDRNFYLPRVIANDIVACYFDEKIKLEKSEMNILEPCSAPISPMNLDLVVVPALIVDKNNYRLGYGGGFYDRFIENYGSNFTTVSLIPKELYIEKLPIEEFDQKIDFVITNN